MYINLYMFKFDNTTDKSKTTGTGLFALSNAIYNEKTEHSSKKDKFEYCGQQIAWYKYFVGGVMKQTILFSSPTYPLLITKYTWYLY